ncbi:hypothetical protein RZR97_09965 [Hydrogenimonas thermophila]|uniref:hypothetical protein n=1 Tax=Hydrogenimonas thermophila TaxID=223786 RepID=UPI0029374596|nr:hypothetical protein [Hydrogenimonas thermophila]WOE69428.1 hypothetical protein RZR91_09995 [Hydrogenimonas thermophila]WOE71937.1 hypothetical protein RZR97_09965 [Hydrogenimonas thermophila]
MKKKVFSLVCATALGVAFVGCGSSTTTTETVNQSDSIDVATVTLGNDEVIVTPTSSDVVKDNYAFTTSDLGLVTLVKSSEPVDISENELVEDDQLSSIIDTTSPFIVSSKVIPKPISSADGKVSMIIKFDPKLTFDTSVSITNYNSLLALPENGMDLLKNGLKPISSISSDIAFYNSNGERIWDINDKFKNEDTNLSIYLVFDESNPDLKEGNYTLAYYKENGELIEKEILIKPKSDGTLEVALDGVYPFIIAEKNSLDPKQIIVSSELTKTNFELPVVAFDENNSVVGIGKATSAASLLNPPETDLNNAQQEQNFVYLVAEPAKYKLVSYLLKDGYKEFDTNNTTITADDLDPQYPLVDNMNNDDLELIQYKIKSKLQTAEYEFAISNFEYPENYFCNGSYVSNELCEDFKNTLVSIFENNPSNQLKNEYVDDYNTTTCNVTSSVDENKSVISVVCSNGVNDSFDLNKKIDDLNSTFFELSYNLKGEHTNESGSYNLYITGDNSRYIDGLSDEFTENYSSDYEYETYSESNSLNTKVEYKKGVYYYAQSGSVNVKSSYTSYDTNQTEDNSYSFKYDLSKKMYDSANEVENSYALKVTDISSADEITITNKTLVINKDSDGNWHINNSIDGY